MNETSAPTRQEMLTSYAFLSAEVNRRYDEYQHARRNVREFGHGTNKKLERELNEAHDIYWGMVERRNTLAALLWPTPEHEINDPTEY